MSQLTYETFVEFIPQILAAVPEDWRGTTFNNSRLLNREGFSKNLTELVVRKKAAGETISTDDLSAIGNAEDYLRVATNLSTTLELAISLKKNLPMSQVFTFASEKMPIVAVCIASTVPVHLYVGDAPFPFSEEEMELLRLMGCRCALLAHHGCADHKLSSEICLALESAATPASLPCVDGVIGSNILYIQNPSKIPPSEILVVRKRLATPVTTPAAENWLQRLAGIGETPRDKPDTESIAAFHAHLQTMSGTAVDTTAPPVVFTAGLPALCSLWVSMVKHGGVDILMCSTAYGGSSQLTDVLNANTGTLHKHVFHIQGDAVVNDAIRTELARLSQDPSKLMPTTCVFIEIPSNPDMKVPDLLQLTELLTSYEKTTGKQVLLLVDATFAPASQVMRRVREVAPNLSVLVFLSLSKSVSRGLTTAGTVIANHTDFATQLVREIAVTSRMLDTSARDDQVVRLCANHTGVEDRCQRAYDVAQAVGAKLCEAVQRASGQTMSLAFVSPEQASLGFTTSTFSFNLPPPTGASPEQLGALAQQYVDHLTVSPLFKPCVSFGQDNGLVYATVPATSTQGAIKEEDKAKQAVGGVQLVRLSFAPGCDISAVSKVMCTACAEIYAPFS